MSDLMSFLDFAMDIIFMMPSFDEIEGIVVTRDQSIVVSLVAISLLVLAVTISALKEAFPENFAAAVVAAVCITLLGFAGLDHETLKAIFVLGYAPMVIAIRFGEGAIIGGRVSRHLRWWHSLILAGATLALYYLLEPLPAETLVFVKGGWALFGAGLAAFMWTRIVADSPMFRSTFSIICVFSVFASTIVYVSASPVERTFYQWALPIGFAIGIIGDRASPMRDSSGGEFDSIGDEN